MKSNNLTRQKLYYYVYNLRASKCLFCCSAIYDALLWVDYCEKQAMNTSELLRNMMYCIGKYRHAPSSLANYGLHYTYYHRVNAQSNVLIRAERRKSVRTNCTAIQSGCTMYIVLVIVYTVHGTSTIYTLQCVIHMAKVRRLNPNYTRDLFSNHSFMPTT